MRLRNSGYQLDSRAASPEIRQSAVADSRRGHGAQTTAYSEGSLSQTLRTQTTKLRTTAPPARPRHARPTAATRRLIRRGVAASTASTAPLATSPAPAVRGGALGLRRRRRRAVSRRRALCERGDGRWNDGKVSGRWRNDGMENGRRRIRRRGGVRTARRRNRAAAWRWCPPARRRRPAAAAAGSRQRRIRRGAITEKSNSGSALGGVDDHRRSKGPRDGGINRSLDGVDVDGVVRAPPKTGNGRAVVEEQSRLRR